MREIKTEIDISASPSAVWSILTDFDGWKDWNPIAKASGIAAPNSKLKVTMCGKNGKDAQKYLPTIIAFEKPNSFRWRAKMLAGFLFTNDKVFELQSNGSGTHLVHKELFGGLLVSMMWGSFEKHVPPMLKSMNEALKKTAEK